ncbi:hypothetical protein GCM10007938_12240 [Vibrio zhanjiangensis]|uniref:Uncharacterized protein n=1 Tax=Vibrio zhanjiangensis TaxID=1046128 RepID=A0ABQ6EWR0_9VIBR|nr:hypothetical protein GCM10007938_12240 [Vibrio zhanjiangensis]
MVTGIFMIKESEKMIIEMIMVHLKKNRKEAVQYYNKNMVSNKNESHFFCQNSEDKLGVCNV